MRRREKFEKTSAITSNMSESKVLRNLPNEMWHKIFTYLAVKDIIGASLSAKQIYEAIKTFPPIHNALITHLNKVIAPYLNTNTAYQDAREMLDYIISRKQNSKTLKDEELQAHYNTFITIHENLLKFKKADTSINRLIKTGQALNDRTVTTAASRISVTTLAKFAYMAPVTTAVFISALIAACILLYQGKTPNSLTQGTIAVFVFGLSLEIFRRVFIFTRNYVQRQERERLITTLFNTSVDTISHHENAAIIVTVENTH